MLLEASSKLLNKVHFIVKSQQTVGNRRQHQLPINRTGFITWSIGHNAYKWRCRWNAAIDGLIVDEIDHHLFQQS